MDINTILLTAYADCLEIQGYTTHADCVREWIEKRRGGNGTENDQENETAEANT